MVSVKCISLRHIIIAGIALIVLAVVCEAHTEVYGRSQRSKRFCGKILTGTLELLCMGRGYNGMEKKDAAEDDEYYNDQPTEDLSLPTFPFMSRIQGTEMKPRPYRRFRRGVHDECCKKSCTLKELKGYCLNN